MCSSRLIFITFIKFFMQLEILYNGRPLAPEYKLSDVAYIFSWKEV